MITRETYTKKAAIYKTRYEKMLPLIEALVNKTPYYSGRLTKSGKRILIRQLSHYFMMRKTGHECDARTVAALTGCNHQTVYHSFYRIRDMIYNKLRSGNYINPIDRDYFLRLEMAIDMKTVNLHDFDFDAWINQIGQFTYQSEN